MPVVEKQASAGASATRDIDREILRHKFVAVVREMGITLGNAAQSTAINEGRDFAVALADRQGGIVAIDNALHLGSLAVTVEEVLQYFKFDMKDGDLILVSDPYRGGTHVQDVTLVMPYVINNVIVMYFVARGHIPDVGGQHAASYYPNATELWAEGVPFTPVKLRRLGRPARDVITTVLLNTRKPDETSRDLDALTATLELGRRRVEELVHVYGIEHTRDAMTHTQDYTERRVRAEISTWADGEYSGEGVLDHDAAGADRPTVRLSATVDGDALRLDFSASDEQRPSFVNSPWGNTRGCAILPVLTLLGDDIPLNGGVLRAVTVECTPGRMTNPIFPAPVGWGTVHCGAEIAEATAVALRDATKTVAGGLTSPGVLLLARPAADRHAVTDLSRWGVAGAPAAATQDGWGRPALFSRSQLPSVETWESRTELRVKSMEFAPDTAGAGASRGAPGTETVLDLPADYRYTLCVEGRACVPSGVGGGQAGAHAEMAFVGEDGAEEQAPNVLVDDRIEAHRIRLRLAGGSGFGDPFDRDPDAVLSDVLDGLVSREAAENIYGVVLSADGSAVDVAATTARRPSKNGLTS
jgi:N-methylhydantoinase B